MVDIKATREAYRDVIVSDVIWISRKHNIADSMPMHTILLKLADFSQKVNIKHIKNPVIRTLAISTKTHHKRRIKWLEKKNGLNFRTED